VVRGIDGVPQVLEDRDSLGAQQVCDVAQGAQRAQERRGGDGQQHDGGDAGDGDDHGGQVGGAHASPSPSCSSV
jgi:hypothetical protein